MDKQEKYLNAILRTLLKIEIILEGGKLYNFDLNDLIDEKLEDFDL